MSGHVSTKTDKNKSAGYAERNSRRTDNQSSPSGLHADILGLQTSAGNNAVNSIVNSLRGGTPLPTEVCGEMEQRFGEDFSGVRLHTDSYSARTADDLSAKAYTAGNNIVFNEGRFAPETATGKRLLAHELAHVIQQQRGGEAPSLKPNSAHERAADAASNAFVQKNEGAINVMSSTAVGIAREPLDDKAEREELEKRLEVIESQVNKSPLTRVAREKRLEDLKKIRTLSATDKENAERALEALETRMEREQNRKPDYSEAPEPEELTLLEKKKPTPQEIQKAGNMEKAALGELGAKEKAEDEKIKVDKQWAPPQKFKGDYGEGMDAKGRRGDKRIVVEGKYGTSQLGELDDGTVQMSNRWIGKKIAELQLEGDAETARDLLEASQKGDLQGVVYWTRNRKGKEVTERRNGPYLRMKLGEESISESGLISYAPGKVYKAYQEHLDKLNQKFKTNLTPLIQPKSATKGASAVTPPPALVGSVETGYKAPSQPAPPKKPQTPAAKSVQKQQKPIPSPKEPVNAPLAPVIPKKPTSEKKVEMPQKETPVKAPQPQGTTAGPIRQGPRQTVVRLQPPIKKMPPSATLLRGGPKWSGAARGAAAQIIAEALQRLANDLSEAGIRHRTNKELEEKRQEITEYQIAHQDQGVLVIVTFSRSTIHDMPRLLESFSMQKGGATEEEARARWQNEPKYRAGGGENVEMWDEYIWIPPGKHIPLSKSHFINGRYQSDSDVSRMISMQFDDSGAFTLKGWNPETGVAYRVETGEWKLNLDDQSIRLKAKFHDPSSGLTIESEFSVLDGDWLQEVWSTNSGRRGDFFWHKAPY